MLMILKYDLYSSAPIVWNSFIRWWYGIILWRYGCNIEFKLSFKKTKLIFKLKSSDLVISRTSGNTLVISGVNKFFNVDIPKLLSLLTQPHSENLWVRTCYLCCSKNAWTVSGMSNPWHRHWHCEIQFKFVIFSRTAFWTLNSRRFEMAVWFSRVNLTVRLKKSQKYLCSRWTLLFELMNRVVLTLFPY